LKTLVQKECHPELDVMRALHNYNNHQSRHSGQAQRDPESSHKGTGSPPQRERRLDTGLRRYDKICGFVRLCKALVILSPSKDGCQSFLSWFDKLTMTPITYDP
jgi:hypothetical protein